MEVMEEQISDLLVSLNCKHPACLHCGSYYAKDLETEATISRLKGMLTAVRQWHDSVWAAEEHHEIK